MAYERHTKHLGSIEIRASGRADSGYMECIQEALILAATEWRNTEFTYQGKVFRILVTDLVGCAGCLGPVEREEEEDDTLSKTH